MARRRGVCGRRDCTWLQRERHRYGVPITPNQNFVVANNLFLFDRNNNSTPKFWVQGGCVYSGGFPYTQFQEWNSNMC